LLQNYAKGSCNIENLKILSEMESREYKKPSDWMFAEMKVKEIDKNFKEIIKQVQ